MALELIKSSIAFARATSLCIVANMRPVSSSCSIEEAIARSDARSLSNTFASPTFCSLDSSVALDADTGYAMLHMHLKWGRNG